MAMQICGVFKGLMLPSKSATLFRHVSLVKKHTGSRVEVSRQAPKVANNHSINDLHLSSRKLYPEAKPIPLPENIDDIDNSQLACFSPQRDRDILGSVISSKSSSGQSNYSGKVFNWQSYPTDPHVASYDCSGGLSLNSAMQSNVPEPFSSKGKSTHLNMPGGQWSQGQKYIAEDQQKSHYKSAPRNDSGGNCQGTPVGKVSSTTAQQRCLQNAHSIFNCLPHGSDGTQFQITRQYSSNTDEKKVARKDKIKQAVKEYGTTVVVFHIGISLVSLGSCYLAVVSGVGTTGAVETLGPNSEVVLEAGKFVVAYAIHKMLLPVRASITLAATPLIVRYLRGKGYLKPAQKPDIKK